MAAWQEADGSLARGSLTLEPEALLLRGKSDKGHHTVRRISFAELAGVSIDRAPNKQLNGNPTLLVERRNGDPLRISPGGAGLLWELADLLALLVRKESERLERVIVIAKLKEGVLDQARALIAEGPPFDPRAIGLERKEVLLTSDAVVFLFEGREIRELVQRLIQEPGLWEAAVDWDACLTGRPQLADIAYSWEK